MSNFEFDNEDEVNVLELVQQYEQSLKNTSHTIFLSR